MTSFVQSHGASRPRSTLAGALGSVCAALFLMAAAPLLQAKEIPESKPTVVLVHGAFADSTSWNHAVTHLLAKGYPVLAYANPLRGVKSDASDLASVLDSVKRPVILVGHSYGGNVITEAAAGKQNVKALIYVAAIAPETGESAGSLSGKFPGGTLGSALAPPVILPDGSKDLYILQNKFHAQFAADVPEAEAKLMAVAQRPIIEAALNEPAVAVAWKTIPSWFLYGSLDKNIPPAVHAFMAKRAGAREIVEIKGASHVVMIMHAEALVKLIENATVATR